MKKQLNQLVVIVIVLSFLIAGCSSSATPVLADPTAACTGQRP